MSRRIGLILVMLILALGVMGAAYSLWWETVWFVALVNTGEVDIEMSLDSVWPEGDDKGVANCWGEIFYFSVPGYQPDSGGDNRIILHVENAYPSMWCKVWYNIKNIGTIPVHFVVETEGTLPEEAITLLDCPNLEDVQLHEGEEYWCHFGIHFTNDMPVDEDSFYYREWNIHAYQYNESPPASFPP